MAISVFSSLSYFQAERRQAVEHLEAIAALVAHRFEEWVRRVMPKSA